MTSPSSYGGDGTCDFADLVKMASSWLSGDPATDLSGDATINYFDFAMFSKCWDPDTP